LAPQYLERFSTPAPELLPSVSFERVNPTKYRVAVRGAGEPYVLVLSEGFSAEWVPALTFRRPTGTPLHEYPLGIQERAEKHQLLDLEAVDEWFSEPLQAQHFRANGFANGWYVEELGDYDLVIDYRPQRLYLAGLALSLVVTLVALTLSLRRRPALDE
jgi:hypothetical protein